MTDPLNVTTGPGPGDSAAAKPAVAEIDYLPLFAGGLTSDEITSVINPTERLVHLSREEAMEKYRKQGSMLGSLGDEQFDDLYRQSLKSYNLYQAKRYNGNIAPLWMYDTPDGPASQGDEAAPPDSGILWGPAGVDEFGNPTATPSEIAAARGYIIDADGSRVSYKEPGFLGKVWAGAAGSVSALAPPLAPLLLGNDPMKVTTVQMDDKGLYYLKNAYADDESVMRSQILSHFGPQPMKENLISGLLKSVYNGLVPAVHSTVGSLLEKGDDLYDFIAYGRDAGGEMDRLGRALQNLASASMMPVSVEGSMGAFENLHSTVNAIGAMIPLILLTRGATLGLTSTGLVTSQQAAHMGASFGVFTALGIDGYNQAAKSIGMDPAEAAWQAMAVGFVQGVLGLWAGPKFLTRGLSEMEFKNSVTRIITRSLEESASKLGTPLSQMSASQKSGLVKNAARAMSGYIKKVVVPLSDLTTRTGRLVDAAHGGGRMMAISNEAPLIVMETFNDWRALMRDPGASPGRGMFEGYDLNRSFLSQVVEKAPTRLLKSYATGFLGSLAMGLPGVMKKPAVQTLSTIVASGREADALKIAAKAARKGQFGRQDLTPDGQVIPAGELGRGGSVNEMNHRLFTEELQRLATLRDAYGLRDPRTLEILGGGSDLVGKALEITRQLKALHETRAQEADPQKILQADEQIALLKRSLDEIILPEVPGGRYSRAYNRQVKQSAMNAAMATEAADGAVRALSGSGQVTAVQRKTPQYQQLLHAVLSDLKPFDYQAVDQVSERERELFAQARSRREEFFSPEGAESRRKEVEDFIARLEQVGSEAPTDGKTLLSRASSLISSLGSLSERVDFRDAQNELNRSALDTFRKTMAAIDQALNSGEFIEAPNVREALENPPLRPYQEPPEPDPGQIEREVATGQIAENIEGEGASSLKKQMEGQWQDPIGASEQVRALRNQIDQSRTWVNFRSLVLSDPAIRDHLGPPDRPLERQRAAGYLSALDALEQKLDHYSGMIDRERAKNDNYQRHNLVHQLEKGKYALGELAPLLRVIDPDLVGLAQTLPDWTAQERDINVPFTDTQRLYKAARVMNQIKTRLFEHRGEVTGAKGLAAIRQVVASRRFAGQKFSYLKTRDYIQGDGWGDFAQALQATDGQDFLNMHRREVPGQGSRPREVDLGYVWTVNFLVESVGASALKVEMAREALRKNNPGNEISSMEQQAVENLVFAFKNDADGAATRVFETVLDAEREILKQGKGAFIAHDNLVPGLIYLRGEYKTGKTTQVLRNVYEIDRQYNGTAKRVTVIGISEMNLSALRESMKAAPGATFLSDSQFWKDPRLQDAAFAGDDIVIDEASLLGFEHLAMLSKRNPGAGVRIIALGDDGQMKDVRDIKAYPNVEEAGVRTSPLMTKYSLDNPLVNAIAQAFGRNTSVASRRLPGAFTMTDGSGHRQGGRYFNSEQEVIHSFVTATNPDRKLILFEPGDFDQVREMIPENLHDKVFVIAKTWGEPDLDGAPPSVQGLRAREAYIAIDRQRLLDNGIMPEPIRRVMYTSIGRASQWVGLVDQNARELNKLSRQEVAWAERPEPDPAAVDLAKRSAWEQEMARLREVTSGAQAPVAGATTPNPGQRAVSARAVMAAPLPDNTYRVTAGEHDKLYAHYAFSRDGKHFFGVGDTVARARAESLFDISAVEIEPSHLEYLSDEQMALHEPVRHKGEAPQPKPLRQPTRQAESAIQWKSPGKAVWASTHTVLGDINLSERQRQLKRKSTPALHRMVGEWFSADLVYHRRGYVEGEPSGEMVPMGDILTVRLNLKRSKESTLRELKKVLDPEAYAEVEEHLVTEGASELPAHYRNILGLSRVETLSGQARGFSDREAVRKFDDITLDNLADVTDQITRGFVHMEDGHAHAEMNIALAGIIARAKAMLSGDQDQVVVQRNVSLSSPDQYRSTVVQSEKSYPWKEFRKRWEQQGITFGGQTRAVWVETAPGKVQPRIIVHYNHQGYVTHESPWVILRKPRLKEIEGLREILENKRRTDTLLLDSMGEQGNITDILGGTWLLNFINNNRFLLKAWAGGSRNPKALKVISAHGRFQEYKGRERFWLNRDEAKSRESMRRSYKALWDDMLREENLRYFMDMELPSPLQGETLAADTADPMAQYYAFGDQIHSPYAFVSLAGVDPGRMVAEGAVAPVQAISPPVTGHAQEPPPGAQSKKTPEPLSENPFDNWGAMRDDDHRPNRKPAVAPDEVRVSVERVQELFGRIAHPAVWDQIDSGLRAHGLEPLQVSGRFLYGMMSGGKIALEMNAKGIEVTTPKHEFFHLVYNYMLGEQSRGALLREARRAMAHAQRRKAGDFSDLQAEEWMARRYGATGMDTDSPGPAGKKKNLLQRFFDLVRKLFGRYEPMTPELDELMYRIDHGEFRDVMPVVREGDPIERLNPIPQDDFQEYSALEEPNMADTPHAEFYHRELPKIFGRSETITSIRHDLEYQLNLGTDFSLNLDTPHRPLADCIRLLEQYLQGKEALGDLVTGSGKKVSEMGLADYQATLKPDYPSMKDRSNYELYQLSRAPVRRAFLQRSFPGLDFERMELGKYNVSTQWDSWRAWSPEQGKSDFIKFQLRVTPLLTFDALGNPTGRGRGLVGYRDLDRSLKQAGVEARMKYMADPGVSLREHFIRQLNALAGDVSDDNPKRLNILSFVNRFFTGTPGRPSLSWITGDLRDRAAPGDLQRAEAIEDLITAMTQLYTSYSYQRRSVMNLTRNASGEVFYNKLSYARSTAESEKNRIIDRMNLNLFSGGVVRPSIREMVRMGVDEKGRRRDQGSVFDIREDGLYYVRGRQRLGSPERLITVENGRVAFTPEVIANPRVYLGDMSAALGLGGVSPSALMSLMNRTASEGVKRLLREKAVGIPENLDTRSFLAESLMNLMWSLKSNIQATDDLRRIDNNILETSRELGRPWPYDPRGEEGPNMAIEQMLLERRKVVENPLFSEQMRPFRRAMGITEATVDGQESTMGETQMVSRGDYHLPKPTDYYNVFNTLGLIGAYQRGLDHDTFFYAPDKTRQYNFRNHSKVSLMTDQGSGWIADRVEKSRAQGAMERSPFYDPRTGRFLNLLMDRTHGIALETAEHYSGIRLNDRGTTEPNTRDMNSMGFYGWWEGILRSPSQDYQRQSFISTNTDDLMLNTFNFFPSNPRERFISLDRDSEGRISGASVNEEFISRAVATHFHRFHRQHELSLERWRRFAASLAGDESGKALLKLLPRELWEAGQQFDPMTARVQNFRFRPEPAQRALVEMALKRNVDYIETGGEYHFGNALRFKVAGWEDVYNYRNYKEVVEKGAMTHKVRDRWFQQAYKDMAAAMSYSSSQFRQMEDVRRLVAEGGSDRTSGFFRTPYSGRKAWQGDIVEYNPVYKAYFYGFHIANTALGDVLYGSAVDSRDTVDKSKRSIPTHTPAMRVDLSVKGGLRPKGREIVVRSRQLKDLNIDDHAKENDGLHRGSLLYLQFLKKSIGGWDFGPIGHTMVKDLLVHTDFETGDVTEGKRATDFYSGQLFLDSLAVRRMNLDILDTMDRELAQEHGPRYPQGMIRNKFMELWRESPGDADRAFERLHDWIVDEASFTDGQSAGEQITEHLISGFADLETHKMVVDTINEYDPSDFSRGYALRSRPISHEGYGIILNPHQELSDKERLSPPQQVLGMIGVGHDRNLAASKRLEAIQSMLYRLGKERVQKQILAYDADPALSPQDQQLDRFRQFLLDRGTAMIRSMSVTENFAELIADKRNFMVPQVYLKLKESYQNYINAEAIKVPFSGIRVNQSSATAITLFERQGKYYTLRDIERNHPERLKLSGVPFILDPGQVPEGYRPVELSEMISTGQGMRRATIAMPCLFRREFGLEKSETLSDVFTIRFLDGSWVDTRGMDAREVEAVIGAGETAIDYQATPMLRHTRSEKAPPGMLPFEGWRDYLEAFQRSLVTYSNRVPASSLGSGSANEVVMFAEGNGNVAYRDPRGTLYDNSDFDIDQLSVYVRGFKGDERSKLQNEMIDILDGVYMDSANAANIFVKSTTRELREAADRVQASLKVPYRDNDWTTTLEMNRQAKQGSDGIAVAANTLQAYSFLAQLTDKRLVPAMSGILDSVETYGTNSMSRRLEKVLQTLLDNQKERTIGRLGVTADSINILGAFLMSHPQWDTKTAIDNIPLFFRDPVVRRVLDDVELGNSIEESRRTHYIFNAIRRARQTMTSVTAQQAEQNARALQDLTFQLREFNTSLDERIRRGENRPGDWIVPEGHRREWLSAVEPENAVAREDMELKIEELEKLSADSRGREALDKLYGYAIQAEALRRLSVVIDLRNGVKTGEWEFYNRRGALEDILGYDLRSPKRFDLSEQGEAARIDSHMEYFKKSSNAWAYVKDSEHAAEVWEAEKRVAAAMNLPAILDNFAHLRQYLKEYADMESSFSRLSWEGHPVMEKVAGYFLDKVNLRRFDYANRFHAFRQGWHSVFLDHYFKSFMAGKTFNIAIPKAMSDGMTWVAPDSVYSDITLATARERNNFLKQVPLLHDFLVSVGQMPRESALRAIGAMRGEYAKDPGEAQRFYEAIAGNKLLGGMVKSGRDESPMLRLNDTNLSPEQVMMYSMEFQRLPRWLQDVYYFNQVLNTGFAFKQGSILDIVGKEVYTRPGGISQGMERFKTYLDSMSENQVQELAGRFYDYIKTADGAASFLTKDMKENKNYPGVIRKPKFFRSRTTEGGFTVSVSAEYDPADPRRSRRDGYVYTYPVLGRGGFDLSMPSHSVRVEPMRMNAAQIDAILSARALGEMVTIQKSYLRGHNYKVGEVVNADGELMRVVEATATEVFVEPAEGSLEGFMPQPPAPAKGQKRLPVEVYTGRWTRYEVEHSPDKVYLFGDNTHDRTVTHHVPSSTQAVVRGLKNAIGIDTKKARGTSDRDYFSDGDLPWFIQHVEGQIARARATGKTIVIPRDGIGTGKAMLEQKAPKLFEYLTRRLGELATEGKAAPDEAFMTRDYGGDFDGMESRALGAFHRQQGRRYSQRAFEILLEKLSARFPQIAIHPISSQDALAYGKSADTRGWTGRGQVFLNMDKMTSVTAVHEMQHLWNMVYKVRHPERYQQFEQYVSDLMASGSGDIYNLSVALKASYPELKGSTERLLDEMMATVGGFVNRGAAERFLARHNVMEMAVDQSLPGRIYQSVKRFVHEIWDYFRQMFGVHGFDLESAPLREFYREFARKIFSDGPALRFTPGELDIISHVTGESRPVGRGRIRQLSDLADYLTDGPEKGFMTRGIDKDSLTDFIYNRVINNNPFGREYFYQVGCRRFVYDLARYKDKPDLLKRDIRSEIVPLYEELERGLERYLKAFIPLSHKALGAGRHGDTGESLRKASDDIFGQGRLSDSVLEKMVPALGLNHPVREVTSYQELPHHAEGALQDLYTEGLEGFNPLVVVHGIDQGVPDISLIDATSKPLGGSLGEPGQGNIFSRLVSDREYAGMNGPGGWSSRAHSLRRFMVGLQAMAMARKNPRVRFRNIGVVELHGNSLKSYPVTDLGEVGALGGILSSNKALMDILDHKALGEALSGGGIADQEFRQSYVARMNYWLQEQLDGADPQAYSARMKLRRQVSLLFDPRSGPDDFLKVYHRRRLALERSIGDKEALARDPEYQMLSHAIFEIENEGALSMKGIRDMPRFLKRFITPQNHHSEIVQRVIAGCKVSKEKVVEQYMDYHKKLGPLFASVAREYRQSFPGAGIKALSTDMGQDYFGGMWRRMTVMVGEQTTLHGRALCKGERVEVVVPMLHWDGVSDQGLERRMTPAQLALSASALDMLRERQIKNIYHVNTSDLEKVKVNLNELGNPVYTMKDAEKAYEETFAGWRGVVPVMEQGVKNLIAGGKLRRGIEKQAQKFGMDDEFFDDQIGDSSELDGVGSAFATQMNDPVESFARMGLRRAANGEWELFDGRKNETASLNLEKTMNYFMLQSIRKEVYEKEAIPMFNIARSILTSIETLDPRNPQTNNKAFLEEIARRFINRKNADDQFDLTISFFGHQVHTKTVARALMHAFTNMTLFGRPVVGLHSAFFNESRRAFASIANSIANIGIPEESRDTLPTGQDAEKAVRHLISDPKKAFALGRMLHIINREERDLMESPFLNQGEKTDMLREYWGHIFNQSTDMGSRLLAAISYMVHEGSYDAYSFDARSGDILYDPSRDRRFENRATVPAQKVMYDALVNRLRRQGLMKEGETEATRGHDWDAVTNQLKWYGEKWVVSGMDDLSKNLASNLYLTSMFSQFRFFSFDPMINAGWIPTPERESIAGSVFVPGTDPKTGDIISIRERRRIESSLQSLGHVLRDLYDFKKLSTGELSLGGWWRGMPHIRRYNLARTAVQAAAFSIAYALVHSLADENDEKKFVWMYSDLALAYASMQWLNNPIPLVRGATDLVDIAIGNKGVEQLIKYSGPVKGAYELVPEND